VEEAMKECLMIDTAMALGDGSDESWRPVSVNEIQYIRALRILWTAANFYENLWLNL
jgi:hypothetical protein